ncbi:MAG: hypothetical protein ACI9SC_003260, partial [Gammaproteobacteria bacterium]
MPSVLSIAIKGSTIFAMFFFGSYLFRLRPLQLLIFC